MGRALIFAGVILILGGFVTWLVYYMRKQYSRDQAKRHGWAIDGDLNYEQERQLLDRVRSAERIFRDLTAPPLVLGFDPTYLSDKHRDSIQIWIKDTDQVFNSLRKKERQIP